MKKLSKKGKIIILASASAVLILGLSIFLVVKLSKKETKVETMSNKSKENKKVDNGEKINIVDMNSTSRPYAVMINNINVARPLQSGLQDAYIVYELIVEGGITRYLALFLDQNTQRIGSVRSARHYYLDYALENDAIYVHHGQSDQAMDDFSLLNIDRIVVDNSKTGWRDTTLNVSTEHTLFTSIEKLNNGIGKKRTTRNKPLLLDYSAKSVLSEDKSSYTKADKVSIAYSKATVSSYEYDSENKVYKRFVNDSPHKDYVTKEQYTFKNIIVYSVENYDLNDGSGKGRQGFKNIGSGSGYYITEGYSIPITWEKKSRDSQTVYKTLDGNKLVVNDGNTFIQIMPTTGSLKVS